MRGFNIPWEAYAQYAQTEAAGPSHSRTSTSPRDPFAQLNNLTESRRMMSPGEAGGEGGGGMSFAMLCQLISEGRAGEVQGVREIPDQLNVSEEDRPLLKRRRNS